MARIVRFDRFGGPEVLRVAEETPRDPGEGEVRIKVAAFGLNRAEMMFRTGAYVADATFPSRIGIEAVGVVEALGPGVAGLEEGQRVSAVPFLSSDEFGNWTGESVTRYGTYGDSAVLPAFTLVPTPENLSDVEAAASWCQFLTAWGGLVDYAGIGPEDTVLVTAASSSAGLGGLGIAKDAGATVIAATRSGAKADRLLAAGADHVVAFEREDLETRVKALTGGEGASVVYDPVGGNFIGELVKATRPCGTIVNYGNLRTEPMDVPILPFLAKRLNLKFHSQFDTPRLPALRARGFAYVRDRLASGALTPIVDRTFPLEEIVDAHRHMESNDQFGKIVVVT